MHHLIDRLELRRLFDAGQLDTTFGESGTTRLTAPAIEFPFFSADIDSTRNGQVVVTGATSLPTDLDNELGSVMLWRLRPDGSTDTNFGPGDDGLVVLPGAGYATDTVHTVVTPDSGLLVQVATRLYKLKQNGTRDLAFGRKGRVDLGVLLNFDVTVDPDGRIYVPQRSDAGKLIIRRLKPDGSPDTSYADGGTLTPPGDFQPNDFTSRLLPTGKILVAGIAKGTGPKGEFNSASFDLGAVRLNADGSVDTTYGDGGVGRIQFFHTDLYTSFGNTPTITDDGRVYVNEDRREDITTQHTIDSLDPAGQEAGAGVDDAIREAGYQDVVRDDSLFAMITQSKVRYPFKVLEAGLPSKFVPSKLAIQTDGSLLVTSLESIDNGETISLAAQQITVHRLWRDDSPAAQALARTLTRQYAGSYRFLVQYRDDDGIDRTTLGNDDITVQLPDGTRRHARLVSTDGSGSAKSINATYLLTSPDGAWTFDDAGTYSIRVERRAVRDINGNAAAQRVIGTFAVQFPPVVALPGAVPKGIFNDTGVTKKPLLDELTDDQA